MSSQPTPVWEFEKFESYVPRSGFIREYLRYALSCMDAPPLYHILSATTVVSAAISPNTDLIFQGELHPLHMYVLLIGDSGRSRKSSAIKRCIRLAEPVFTKIRSVGDRLWWATASSPEGILDELAKEPNRLMLLNEWTELHRQGSAGYWKHTGGEFWNSLYDAQGARRVKASKATVVITRPRVSMLAASTPSLVNSATAPVDWLGGKMARYVIGCASRPTNLEMDAPADYPAEADKVRADLERLTSINTGGNIEVSDAAWEVMRAWRKSPWWRDLNDRAPLHLHPSFARADEHLFRMAALYEATITYPFKVVVSPASMEAAIRVIEWCYDDMVRTFAVSDPKSAQPLDKVAALIAAAGSEGITRDRLLRNAHITARQLNEATGTLLESGQIRSTPTTSGVRFHHVQVQ